MPTTGSPLGSTPFGVGTPASVVAPPDAVRAMTRKLDELSRDYVMDSTGREFERMPRTKQRIYLALLTLRGSSPALPRLGVAMPRKLNGQSPQRIKASVRDALSDIVRDGAMVIRRIDVEIHPTNPSRTIIGIEYLDVQAGRPDSARAAL